MCIYILNMSKFFSRNLNTVLSCCSFFFLRWEKNFAVHFLRITDNIYESASARYAREKEDLVRCTSVGLRRGARRIARRRISRSWIARGADQRPRRIRRVDSGCRADGFSRSRSPWSPNKKSRYAPSLPTCGGWLDDYGRF